MDDRDIEAHNALAASQSLYSGIVRRKHEEGIRLKAELESMQIQFARISKEATLYKGVFREIAQLAADVFPDISDATPSEKPEWISRILTLIVEVDGMSYGTKGS